MTNTLELVIQARNTTDAGFKALIGNIQKTEESTKKATAATEQWSKTTVSSTSKLGAMADTIGRTSTTLARSADAFGLPIGPLRALDDVMDVAEIGFSNLGKSAAGFNVQSVAVVGAALAIGSAIGSWLNTFPQVTAGMDNLRDSLMSLIGMESLAEQRGQAMADITGFQTRMAKNHEEAVARQIARQKELGRSIEDIAAQYKKAERPARTAQQIAEAMAAAHKKGVEASKAAAVEDARRFEEGTRIAERYYNEQLKLAEKYAENKKKLDETISKITKQVMQEDAEEAARIANKRILDQMEAYDRMTAAMQEWAKKQDEEAEDEKDRQEARRQGWIDTASAIAGVMDSLAGVLHAFGVSADSDLGRAISAMQDFAHAGEQAAAAFANFASGNIMAGIGGALNALGGIAKGIKGLFFGGQEEHKKVNDLRDAFIAAAGGLGELDKKAHEAGLTLTALLNAKTVNDYQKAIEELNGAFNIQNEATEKLKAAMEEYGLTIADMGPKFAQQELDKQAQSLIEKYQLLTAAGADHNRVLEAMGPNIVEYVNQAREAGVSIPEDMRKVVEELIAQGKLLDENGEAFETAEEAGITFGKSLQDSMAKAAEQMERLVEAISRLYGLGEINIPVNVHPSLPGNENPRSEHFQGGGMVTGWGVPAVLHGSPSAPEFIFEHEQVRQLLAEAVAAGAAANGGSNGGSRVINLNVGGERFYSFVEKGMETGRIRPRTPARGR